jgi:hypothetical protein
MSPQISSSLGSSPRSTSPPTRSHEIRRKSHVRHEGTPNIDRVKADGKWNTVWGPFYDPAPVWTDKFAELLIGMYESAVLSHKDMQVLRIAFNTSYAHAYAPGTRRHIRNAPGRSNR